MDSYNWDFDLTGDVPSNEDCYNLAETFEVVKQYACKIKYNQTTDDTSKHFEPYNLWLLGCSGIGKTHLATKLINGLNGSTINVPRYFRLMVNSGYWGNIDDALNRVGAHTPVLIDDIKRLGGNESTFVAEGLYVWMEIVKSRWCIWTSNYTLDQFKEVFGNQVFSRIHRGGNVIVPMNEILKDYSV